MRKVLLIFVIFLVFAPSPFSNKLDIWVSYKRGYNVLPLLKKDLYLSVRSFYSINTKINNFVFYLEGTSYTGLGPADANYLLDFSYNFKLLKHLDILPGIKLGIHNNNEMKSLFTLGFDFLIEVNIPKTNLRLGIGIDYRQDFSKINQYKELNIFIPITSIHLLK